MKNIKLWFTAFWPSFDKRDNLFTYILSKKYKIILTPENPEIVITDDSRFKYQNAKMVYFSGEPFFDIGNCDYALTSFYVDYKKFFRVPLYLVYAYEYYKNGITNSYDSIIKNKIYNSFENKTNFCAYISRGGEQRGIFFKKLNQYKFVHSMGSHYNNSPQVTGEPGTISGSIEKYKILKKFKFCMSFENSSFFKNYYGYTTEKIYEPFIAGCVPIYWGNKKINEDFNSKCFINWHDYGSDEATINKIIEIDSDNDMYMDYLLQPIPNLKNIKIFSDDYLIEIFEEIVNG